MRRQLGVTFSHHHNKSHLICSRFKNKRSRSLSFFWCCVARAAMFSPGTLFTAAYAHTVRARAFDDDDCSEGDARALSIVAQNELCKCTHSMLKLCVCVGYLNDAELFKKTWLKWFSRSICMLKKTCRLTRARRCIRLAHISVSKVFLCSYYTHVVWFVFILRLSHWYIFFFLEPTEVRLSYIHLSTQNIIHKMCGLWRVMRA